MEYPLQIDLDVKQEDFIQVDILEQAIDAQIYKNDMNKTFKIEMLVTLAVTLVMAVAVLNKAISIAAFIIPLIAFTCFVALRLFDRNQAERDFAFGTEHLIENNENHTFFTEEKGMALFYEDKCEYLTNEQRRYFGYDKIKHIKITKNLFIFVMKKTKEKNLKGFAYMIIPKRNCTDEEENSLLKICESIKEKYALDTWTDINILD